MRSIVTTDSDLLQDGHQPQPRFRIPQDLPPSISRLVIPVTESEDIFKEFQSRRERNYHKLIRRFVNQILYGCTNPACKTPTCLGYQKRTTKTPLRKLTPLSARTLACYLASESNPEAALCPYCPLNVLEHETQPAVKKRPRRKSHNVTFESSEKDINTAVAGRTTENGHLQSSLNGTSRPGVLVNLTRDAPDLDDSRAAIHEKLVDNQQEKAGAKGHTDERLARDPKSFTQSLFDTLPLRMLEWLPFQPRRESDVQARRSPSWRATDDDVPLTRASRDLTGTSDKRFNQRPPPLVSQKPSRRFTSDGSTKLSHKAPQVLPNGDARHNTEDDPMLRPRHTTRSSSLNPHERGPTECPDNLPMSMSFLDDRKSSRQTSLSLSSSLELRKDPAPSTGSRKQDRSESDHSHNLPPSKIDDRDPDTDDRPFLQHPVALGGDPVAAVYTLEQIPGRVLRDLHLMQARMEKQCLGYQLTDPRPWPDDPKPQENLALRFSDWSAFTKQCCFYILKDPCRLATAFEWDRRFEDVVETNEWPRNISPYRGYATFDVLYGLQPSEAILRFLSYSLDQVFLSTPELIRPFCRRTNRDPIQRRSLASKQSLDRKTPGLNNKQAAFICAVTLYALGRLTVIKHQCSLPDHAGLCWRLFCKLRSFGRILPANLIAALDAEHDPACHLTHLKGLTDVFESKSALDLVTKLAKAINNRVTFSEVSNTRSRQVASKKRQSVLQLLMEYLKDPSDPNMWASDHPRPSSLSSVILEWLRTILLREWDGQPIVRRAGAVGGALQMLAAMYEDRLSLRLDAKLFHTPFFADRLDSMEMPVEWLSYRPDNKTFHLLSYSFLFPPATLVTYFRALNFATMSKSFETALITSRHVSQFAYSGFVQVANDVELLTTMRPAMATYLVLNVRRSNVVTDAMNQLWRRQKRELMRPLKVRMGMDEGEEGIDHGGVQQEFFRCLFAEALDPRYGMFTIDEKTRMTWFQPCSLEPLYKFELLGILFSISVYNSVTLPVTFPVAFYRKLLDLHVKKLNHIQDGWPDLAKGLQQLLDWSDGDVGDVFMRTYEFSFGAFGDHVDVDMQRVSRDDPWPPPNLQKKSIRKATPPESEIGDEGMPESPIKDSKNESPNTSSPPSASSEVLLVTNTNRKQYVKDYIFWLTTKSISPQFSAFARGFYTCLSPTALSIFTPPALKSVIEGSQHINISELESITKYEDGYTAESPTIKQFWEVVRAFSDDEKRGLLEFVTASERVPVNGLGSVVFVVQRSGDDDSRLPTSMTCFGRLLLPQYSGVAVLREKLGKAIENSRGFGVA